MHRFQVLEKEINKGISIDDKNNQIINGWSPNNVRRLVVGFDFAIVQYFVTGGKYNKLIEIVDLRRAAVKDIEVMQTEPQKYKEVLGVLTQGRICSSIEEIIFCTANYPQPMLQADQSLAKLVPSNSVLENRFVRLNHVSLVNAEVKTVAKTVAEAKAHDALLVDKLKESGVAIQTLAEPHKEDWWKGVSLRPKYYAMDLNTLPEYFEKVKEKVGQAEKAAKLTSIDAQQNSKTMQELTPAIYAVSSMFLKNLALAQQVFDKAPILSKAEWASYLNKDNMLKGIKKELLKHEEAINRYRRIDIEKFRAVGVEMNLSDSVIDSSAQMVDMLFDEILGNTEQYKRDSNKLSLKDSLKEMQKLTGFLFNTQVNIVYLSFAKYLNRNTPKYASFFYEQLSQGVENLQYTRSVVEYCNKHSDEGSAKEAFDAIDAKEVLVEAFPIQLKNQLTKQILLSLGTVK